VSLLTKGSFIYFANDWKTTRKKKKTGERNSLMSQAIHQCSRQNSHVYNINISGLCGHEFVGSLLVPNRRAGGDS
jgi:hypothetical protein